MRIKEKKRKEKEKKKKKKRKRRREKKKRKEREREENAGAARSAVGGQSRGHVHPPADRGTGNFRPFLLPRDPPGPAWRALAQWRCQWETVTVRA